MNKVAKGVLIDNQTAIALESITKYMKSKDMIDSEADFIRQAIRNEIRRLSTNNSDLARQAEIAILRSKLR